MSDLVNRVRFTTSIDKKTIERIKDYSKKTMIPIGRILDKAINEYIDKKTSN